MSVYTTDANKLLPRPISICEIDKEAKRLRLVYRVTGEKTGTKQFSELKAGDFCTSDRTFGKMDFHMKRQKERKYS